MTREAPQKLAGQIQPHPAIAGRGREPRAVWTERKRSDGAFQIEAAGFLPARGAPETHAAVLATADQHVASVLPSQRRDAARVTVQVGFDLASRVQQLHVSAAGRSDKTVWYGLRLQRYDRRAVPPQGRDGQLREIGCQRQRCDANQR